MSKAKSSKTKATVKKVNVTTPSHEEMESILQSYYHDTPEQLLEKTSLLTKRHPYHSFGWEFTGLAYEMLGDLDNALYATKRAAQISPMDPEIQTNLGNLLKKFNKTEEAQSCYRKALRIKPNLIQAKNGLGVILDEQKKHQEAEKLFREAIRLEPNYASAYSNLALCLYAQSKNQEAEKTLFEFLAKDPNNSNIWHNLGHIKQHQGKLNEAEDCYMKSVSLDSQQISSYNGLSSLYNYSGKYEIAQEFAEKSLSIDPNHVEALNNMGNCLSGQGNIRESELFFNKALNIKKDHSASHNNLGNLYLQTGRYHEAIKHFSLAIGDNESCFEIYSNLIFCQNFLPKEERNFNPKSFGELARKHAKFQFENHPWKGKHDSIKIGFVSGDLREHSVSRFLIDTIENISLQTEKQVLLFAYSNSPFEDDFTDRLKMSFDRWHVIFGMQDEAVANLIYQEEIDVLIDLSGHTRLNRLPIFCYRPAPIQISWLGYFATTGLAEIDYIFVDKVGVPEGSQEEFSEKLYFLPETRLSFSRIDDAPEVSPAPSLKNKMFTFGCFQNLSKVSDEVICLWAKILQEVEGSRLRWQCMQFNDELLVKETKERLNKYGISNSQLTLLPSVNRQAYFDAYSEVDLVLDTFPYTGGTTTCEALWMGVPTLTLAGENLLARQGASLLKAAGLSEFIADNKEQYIQIAITYSNCIGDLDKLRGTIRSHIRETSLFDQRRFTSTLLDSIFDIIEKNS